MTDLDFNSSRAEDGLGLLIGAESIAAFLGMTSRQIYHACERRRLPVFRIGATVCARKGTLLRWIEQQEAAAEGWRHA